MASVRPAQESQAVLLASFTDNLSLLISWVTAAKRQKTSSPEDMAFKTSIAGAIFGSATHLIFSVSTSAQGHMSRGQSGIDMSSGNGVDGN